MNDSDFTLGRYLHDGGGETGALMRSIDWAATPLGPVAGWSQALRTMVGVLLRNRFPLILMWGPEFIQFYNDPYRPILGAKHPAAMGQPGPVCFAEIWHVIGPMFQAPLSGEPATWSDDLLLFFDRHGFVEETHFKVAYSPVPDETVTPSGVGGVLATVAEITQQIYGERQLRTLRELGARAAEAKTPEDACRSAAETLGGDPRDVLFALFYLLDDDSKTATLAGAYGLDPGNHPAAPRELAVGTDIGWPLAAVIAERRIEVSSNIGQRFEQLPISEHGQAPHTAIVLPLGTPDQPRVYGFCIVGVSPHRALDDGYRSFFEVAAGQVVTAIRNARAYVEERRRAEALAEIDRAKSAFFSNVSHEFRTPLTLMLGPTEDALARPDGLMSRADLETLHRNELRLLKLVNSLLDFSRVEAGRVLGSYQATDLSTLTLDLASSFRAAIERASLCFEVSCPPLSEPVFVDRGMWEKVVLNLLSNALKFTFEGAIAITLREVDGNVELTVRDTGTGIPETELPHLFERFHRVQGAKARTHEGSGIGLALVHELVKLHGGQVAVTSTLGRGSAFSVKVPRGRAHLPTANLDPTPVRAVTDNNVAPYVEEALRWLPDADAPSTQSANEGAKTREARLLVVDDNADMREYLVRTLSRRWSVDAAANGKIALDIARQTRPAMIITDIMMPELDGFGLLREVRADAVISRTPVMMLSARAGDEARIEGIEAGADDYLVKPFSARELVARVGTHLQLGQLQAVAERERKLAEAARAHAESANRSKDEFVAMLGHELRNPLAPILTALELMRLRNDSSFVRERAVIERQARHLARLVDDLLDVSRIAQGKVTLDRAPHELATLISQSIEVAAPLLEERRHELVTKVPVRGFLVHGDEARLVQVFSNLLTNAAKYTDAGGRIAIEAKRDGDGIVLSVVDTGRGISAEMLPHVFDLFAQEHQNLDGSRGGLGLGLAIVKSLVALHGGSVAAESAGLGHGSRFSVRLPVTHQAAEVVVGAE